MQNIQDTTITETLSDTDLDAELEAMRARADAREEADPEAPKVAGRLPPKKKTAVARGTAKPEKAAKVPKAPKAKVERVKVEKPVWAPSTEVAALLTAMDAIDHMDKKGIAAIVKAAVELRENAKHTRLLAAEAAEDETVETVEDDGDVSGE